MIPSYSGPYSIGNRTMPTDRVAYQSVRPTWGRPSSSMTVRYVAHPELRLAFIQTIVEPGFVYVVQDEPLPESLEMAMLIVGCCPN
jgi:hypothetical protein